MGRKTELGTLWRWLYRAIPALFAGRIVFKALATAWVWNGDQIMAALLGTVLFAVLAIWGGALLLYGPEGALARWGANRQGRKQLSLRFFLLSLLSWIAITAGLVAVFEFTQR